MPVRLFVRKIDYNVSYVTVYVCIDFKHFVTFLHWFGVGKVRSDEVSVRPLLQFRNGHECANEDMLWQTFQFLVHSATRMIVDSFVVVPAVRSMLTVFPCVSVLVVS